MAYPTNGEFVRQNDGEKIYKVLLDANKPIHLFEYNTIKFFIYQDIVNHKWIGIERTTGLSFLNIGYTTMAKTLDATKKYIAGNSVNIAIGMKNSIKYFETHREKVIEQSQYLKGIGEVV